MTNADLNQIDVFEFQRAWLTFNVSEKDATGCDAYHQVAKHDRFVCFFSCLLVLGAVMITLVVNVSTLATSTTFWNIGGGIG